MSTTVHIPPTLLKAIDRRVKDLKMSRNKFICMVLEKEVCDEWPTEFSDRKRARNPALAKSVDDMVVRIAESRNSKISDVF